MDSIIEISNVKFEYVDNDNVSSVLNDLSLNIERGSFTVILGHNGSGKSTLAKALRQMLDKTPYALNTLCISAKKIGDIYKSREESDSWNRINTATCKILFIDDFGMEEDVVVQYGNKTQPMAMLIHNRYDSGLTTIITTNLTAEQMAKKYDDRIMDRLNGYARLPYNHISFRRTM
jgi:DNA replication protein DnaC